MNQSKKADAAGSNNNTAAKQETNFLTPKKQTMGQEKKMTDEIAISLSNEIATPTISINVESEKVQKILEFVKEKNAGVAFFDGFEDHILGYTMKDNALIYDGHAILYLMAAEYMKEDGIEDCEDVDMGDYFNQANDILFNCGLESIVLATGRNIYSSNSIVYPIIVFYPQIDIDEYEIGVKVKPKALQFKEVVQDIINSDEDPRILKGFEDQYYAYDIYTRAFVYSGEGIIKQIADEKLMEDKAKNIPLKTCEIYYAEASEFVKNGGILSSFLYEGKNTECDYNNNEVFEPIIMFESIN